MYVYAYTLTLNLGEFLLNKQSNQKVFIESSNTPCSQSSVKDEGKIPQTVAFKSLHFRKFRESCRIRKLNANIEREEEEHKDC